MKIRNGFVSNSSSSSFVVDLNDIPESKRDYFNQLVGHHNDNSCEGYLIRGKRFVHGEIDQHSGEPVMLFLDDLGIYYEVA